eukprot:8627278-Pyramimonas_sp.AAC.1
MQPPGRDGDRSKPPEVLGEGTRHELVSGGGMGGTKVPLLSLELPVVTMGSCKRAGGQREAG